MDELREPQELTEAQENAFDALMDMGGDSKWVPAREVGHHQTIKALSKRRIVQIAEIDGIQHCALYGVYLDEDE